jgi:hypothetical protein
LEPEDILIAAGAVEVEAGLLLEEYAGALEVIAEELEEDLEVFADQRRSSMPPTTTKARHRPRR